eukprot:1113835-Pyramimonas_sp.AAC.1
MAAGRANGWLQSPPPQDGGGSEGGVGGEQPAPEEYHQRHLGPARQSGELGRIAGIVQMVCRIRG